MSHPLAPQERSAARPIGRAWVGIIVRDVGGDALVTASTFAFPVLNGAARFAPLPSRFRVYGVERYAQMAPLPGTRFWISADTDGPAHLLIEAATLPVPIAGLRDSA